jgi:cytochrome c553
VFIAGTPGEGARALSRSAMWCGQCHLAAGVTAGVDDSPPPAGDGVLPHMLRHRWMVDRLWEGLIGPSDEAWARGAAALVAEAALLPSATPHGEHRGYAVDVMSRYVHEAGEAAAEAKDPSARAKVLGDLLATCADCHDESRRQPCPAAARAGVRFVTRAATAPSGVAAQPRRAAWSPRLLKLHEPTGPPPRSPSGSPAPRPSGNGRAPRSAVRGRGALAAAPHDGAVQRLLATHQRDEHSQPVVRHGHLLVRVGVHESCLWSGEW